MVLLIIIPMKNGYFIGNINPTFSDKPMLGHVGTGHVGTCWDMLGHWVDLFFFAYFLGKKHVWFGCSVLKKKPYTCSNINDQENRQASPGGQTCALPQLSALLGAAGTGRPGQWMWGLRCLRLRLKWQRWPGVGKCPILGILDITLY